MSVLEAVGEEHKTSKAAPESEGALLDALLVRGDRDAAERLVEVTYQQIFAALVRLCGDRELAADLTQETYRKAWTSLRSFRRGASFSTWLYRIAYNTFLNHLRRPALMRPLHDGEEERLLDPRADIESTAASHELESRLRALVVGLPEDLRFAVTAYYWGGAPVAEIAIAEQITVSAVRKRLGKAVAQLRSNVTQQPKTPSNVKAIES